MTHKRQVIREAIASRLETIPALLGRTVKTRSRPTNIDELPVAIVYTLRETSDLATIAGDLDRTLTAMIEIRASSVGALDDTLDTLCSSVEGVMSGDPCLGGLALTSYLAETTIGLDGEGEGRQAVATMSYQIRYQAGPSGT